jgi:hypothetical protein
MGSRTRKSGSDVKAKAKAPAFKAISWVDRAEPEEIAEAILSVGHDKAALVVRHLVLKGGSDFVSHVQSALDRLERDPVRSLVRAIGGSVRGILG